jgi:hypothetical protein
MFDSFIRTDMALLTCPIKEGNYSITNWEVTDEFMPESIRNIGKTMRSRKFRANLKLFTKLSIIPKNKPFFSYFIDGENKV